MSVPWVYLDDHWDENQRVLYAYEADPLSVVLYVAGLTYCRRASSRGSIPTAKVRTLLGWRPRAERALVNAGLWEKHGEAVDIHDWDQWNPSDSRTSSARNAARVRWSRKREEDPEQ